MMNNSISNQGPINIAAKQAIDSSQNKKSSNTEAVNTGINKIDSSVELSVNLKDKISAANYDGNKVDEIKNAIKEGNYPLNDKRIAESFIALEKLIG